MFGSLPDRDPDNPDFSLDKIIRDNGMMANIEELRIPLDSSILAMAANIAPFETDVNVEERPLSTIRYTSTGLRFGKVMVATSTIESKNVIRKQKKQLKILPGEPFIGVSFTLS